MLKLFSIFNERYNTILVIVVGSLGIMRLHPPLTYGMLSAFPHVNLTTDSQTYSLKNDSV
jgi:hypothetical protein